jgi:tetratricopeptide (TPR) repeat protein
MPRPLAALLACFLAASSEIAPTSADEGGGDQTAWVGKQVMTTRPEVEMKVFQPKQRRTEVVGIVGYPIVEVRAVQGELLWVRSQGLEGWIHKSEVVGLDRAVSHFSKQIAAHPNDAELFFRRSLAWHARGEDVNAIKDLTEVIRLEPDDAAYGNRGALREIKQEYELALADFDEAIHLDPKSANAYYNRGYARFMMNQFDEAIVDFDQAVQLDPQFVRAYNNRGFCRFKKEEYERAMDDFDEALRLDPSDSWALANRGRVWMAKHAYDNALRDFEHALRLDPNSALAHKNRGLTRLAMKQYAEALTDFDEALRLTPRDARLYNHRALAWEGTAEYDKALSDFTESLRLHSADSEVLANRGDAWHARGEYRAALGDYSEAIRLNPDEARAYAGRAGLWTTCPDRELRNPARAVESARRACELSAWNNPEWIELLAAACAEAGRLDQAVKWEQLALKADDFGDDRKAAGRGRLDRYAQLAREGAARKATAVGE